MKISLLPFYYNSHNTPDNGGRPHILPFNLTFDKELKMFRQVSTPELNETLLNVYSEGSLVDGSISSESGKHYIAKIINYIIGHFSLETKTKILEIGYGSGIFLKELKKFGCENLAGVEPGKHELVDSLGSVNLIQDYYPTDKFKEFVDLIFHSLVLEHIENPIEFIKAQSKQLNQNGKIIFFVPNVEPFINNGDCSSFIHEHFNYFTKESICKLIEKAGLFLEDISIIDGLLAITVTKNQIIKKEELIYQQFDDSVFYSRLERIIENLKIILKQYLENDIALYVPGKALNSMFLLNIKGPRLIDDNTEIHGKYLPYFDNMVEPFETLLKNPPKVIFIWSKTFGVAIKSKCLLHSKLADTKIFTLDDLYTDIDA